MKTTNQNKTTPRRRRMGVKSMLVYASHATTVSFVNWSGAVTPHAQCDDDMLMQDWLPLYGSRVRIRY